MSFPTPFRSCLSFLLLLTLREASAQKAIQPATFRTSVEMVLVPVTVTDHDGRTMDGLRPDDFSVFDDQSPQKIVSFSSDDAPCSVGLVLDISGSMQPALNQAKEIARDFLGTANPDDDFLLLTVSTQPAAPAAFTTDIAQIEESIGLARPGGLTALIDTVYLGLSRMREAGWNRRALLIVSDGMDNHSQYSESELMRVALEADVQIYTIVMDTGPENPSSGRAPYRPSLIAKPWDRAAENQGPEMLEKLSDKTGGLHFRARTNAEAKEAVIKVGRALRDEYVIGYHPADHKKSGKWHRIRVKLSTSGTHVYARKGYYSP